MNNGAVHKLLYLAFFGIGAALSFFKLGLFASLLDKSNFGVYTLIFSSYVYIIYAFSGGANEYVLKMGSLADTTLERQSIRNTALFNGCASMLLGVLIVAPVFWFGANELYRSVFFCGALLAIAALPFSIFESYFRTEAALLKFSGMMAAKAALVILILLFVPSLADYTSAINVEFAALAIVASAAFVYFVVTKQKLSSPVKLSLLKSIWRNGYAFSLSIMFKNSITVIDKVLMSVYLGTVQLGYYAFVLIIYQATLLGSGVIMSVVGPALLGKVRDGMETTKLAKVLLFVAAAIIAVSAIIVLPVQWLFELGVSQFFEQYDEPVTYQLFLLIYLASVVTFISSILDWYYLAVSKEKLLTLYSSISLAIACVGFVAVGQLSLGLYWFVFVFAGSRFISVLAQVFYLTLMINRENCDAIA